MKEISQKLCISPNKLYYFTVDDNMMFRYSREEGKCWIDGVPLEVDSLEEAVEIYDLYRAEEDAKMLEEEDECQINL